MIPALAMDSYNRLQCYRVNYCNQLINLGASGETCTVKALVAVVLNSWRLGVARTVPPYVQEQC